MKSAPFFSSVTLRIFCQLVEDMGVGDVVQLVVVSVFDFEEGDRRRKVPPLEMVVTVSVVFKFLFFY
jgi:hypothetical protein